MNNDEYKNIDIAAKNIRAILRTYDFTFEEKRDLIIIATRKILDSLKLM